MNFLERKISLASFIIFPSLTLALGGAHPHRSVKREGFNIFVFQGVLSSRLPQLEEEQYSKTKPELKLIFHVSIEARVKTLHGRPDVG